MSTVVLDSFDAAATWAGLAPAVQAAIGATVLRYVVAGYTSEDQYAPEHHRNPEDVQDRARVEEDRLFNVIPAMVSRALPDLFDGDEL